MLRGAQRWWAGYLVSCLRRRRWPGTRHVLLCVADHFEPLARTVLPSGAVTGGRPAAEGAERVRDWCAAYAAMADGLRDDDGLPPRHTFFYPWEEYHPPCLDRLAAFCGEGLGEVEIHLHHRRDTPEGLREKLGACRDAFASRHGLLARVDGRPRYGFVHGNWALCNARPDGDWCGVNAELAVLRETSCYADFTFPSAPSPTQPRVVNEVYSPRDPFPGERGHRLQCRLRAGTDAAPGPICIPGPLGLRWDTRTFGLFPRLENGEISVVNPATDARLALWLRLQVHVPGRPDWVIVKLHTHGMSDRSRDGVIGPAMRRFHETLRRTCAASSGRLRFHYATARELYNMVRAAEAGRMGNPGDYRDFELPPPPAGKTRV